MASPKCRVAQDTANAVRCPDSSPPIRWPMNNALKVNPDKANNAGQPALTNNCQFIISKIRADTAFPALTIGDPVFIGVTAGDIQVAAPSGSGDQVRCVGHAITADAVAVNISPVWLEIE